jgi:hypothetical protein
VVEFRNITQANSMNTNDKKKLSPLEAADLPTGSYPPS